jgi:hypothetical protein
MVIVASIYFKILYLGQSRYIFTNSDFTQNSWGLQLLNF